MYVATKLNHVGLPPYQTLLFNNLWPPNNLFTYDDRGLARSEWAARKMLRVGWGEGVGGLDLRDVHKTIANHCVLNIEMTS